MRIGCTCLLILLLWLPQIGCQRPMFPAGNTDGSAGLFQRLPNGQVLNLAQEQQGQLSQLSDQMSSLNQQLARFDADNQGLHAQVASLQQKLDNANNYNYQLKQQLRDATVQLQQMQANKQELEQRLASNPSNGSNTNSPYHLAGSATLRANNSLMGKLNTLQSAGVNAWMDGDVIRVEFPSDQLFTPGTFQLQPAQQIPLNQLTSSIRQHFPRQFIGVEAHWDDATLSGGVESPQQLTATQALTVFNHLTQSGLPAQQLFTVGMGNSRPRYGQGSPKNRRVEIVIYPEAFGSGT